MSDQISQSEDALQRTAVDRSAKLPVLFFITTAVFWLLVSTILGFFSAVKVVNPEFLGDGWFYWTHYGRLHPAFITSLLYGWGFNAAFGVMIWMMARLCRVPVKNPWTLVALGHVWNIALTAGIIGIFAGHGTGLQWLEFPDFVWPVMLGAFIAITVWMVVTYRVRQTREPYISLWYMLGACFWFTWTFATANLFLRHIEKAGAYGAAINAWYTGTLILLFFVPVGLASIYFIVPKITGRPIANYQFATIGFWGIALFGGWTGIQKLMAGPYPVWIPGVSGTATILILVPILAIAVNHYRTVGDKHTMVSSSPSLRFSFTAGMSLVAWGIISAFMATFGVGKYTQFTIANDGNMMLVIYLFFTSAMFSMIYFMVPRLVGTEWFSAKLIRQHYWFTIYGMIGIVVCLIGGGLAQGASIASWDNTAVGALDISIGYLIGTGACWLFIGYSNLMFFLHLVLMICRLGRRSSEPTLLRDSTAHA